MSMQASASPPCYERQYPSSPPCLAVRYLREDDFPIAMPASQPLSLPPVPPLPYLRPPSPRMTSSLWWAMSCARRSTQSSS